MGLAARAANEHDVARLGGEFAGIELADLLLVDQRLGKLEPVQIAVQRELGGAHLIVHRARLTLDILGLQQAGEDIERGARALDSLVDDFVKRSHHPMQAPRFEPGNHLKPLHGSPPGWPATAR